MALSSTRSIDVGGVFLMDMSMNESEFDDEPTDAIQNGDNSVRWTINNHHQDKSIKLSPTYRPNQSQYSFLSRTSKATNIVASQQSSRLTSSTSRPRTTQGASNDYLGSSLDRLASVINCDGQKQEVNDDDGKPIDGHDVEHSPITGAYHQPQQPYDFKELQSSCSLSDESYVASGEASLTASLAYSSEEQDFGDRGSTTTREDSGVLDMKDLEGQLNNGSYDYDDERQHDHRRASANSASKRPIEQEKSISSNIMATNLINNSANGNKNFQYQKQMNSDCNKQQHRSINKPTDGTGNTTTNNHQHHQSGSKTRSNHSGRSVAASLPIEVPARQMKRKLNRMKLNLLQDEEQPSLMDATIEAKPEKRDTDNSPVRKGDRNRPALENIVAFDDDEAFLDQEFNANHHNHYPIDELDCENLTAQDDPMKLFASIQALARSLHEDAELFGSLPPKRMLESPIRSIALV